MWYVIFGGLLVFTGFYLIIKCMISRKKGIHLDAQFVGFQDEGSAQYPVFRFVYEGEEITLPGGVSAKPGKFKHDLGEKVRIIFNPSNRKFVDIEGSATEYLYGIGSIILGGILVYGNLYRSSIHTSDIF